MKQKNQPRGQYQLHAKAGLAPLAALFQGLVRWPAEFRDKRKPLYTLETTFWLFLGQVLAVRGSCQEATACLLARLGRAGRAISASNAAYCKARARLPQAALDQVLGETAGQSRDLAGGDFLWCGRRVKTVDGSSISMPDTLENQARWPQPKGQKPGCGFPVMRLVVLFCLASGAVIEYAGAALDVGERTLSRMLWTVLEAGDILLADRGFCSFADYVLLSRRGVDCVMRKSTRVGVKSTREKRLGKDDNLVRWHKSSNRPKWMDLETWRDLPKTVLVREITVRIAHRGFRSKRIDIATTLLDPKAYSKKELAELYRRRWAAELWLRDLKITLGADVLRCKSPEMIQKELTMHLIGYNLMRALMLQAARRGQRRPRELAFKPCLATMRQWAGNFAGASNRPDEREENYALLLDAFAKNILPKRDGRTEPRARKRRPKNYQLLTEHRKIFKEVPHRNAYKAA